ncbi:hypothetical protein ACH4SP_26910 [Streptomyces sp. NPDC021093]|uniref:hypothetical protein n=1 Tax=Streptomyces sp. NPDC021093 TaxID=3365112 RepID=UPI0037A84F6B
MADAPRSHRPPYRRRALAVLPACAAATAAVFVVCAVLAALVMSGLPGADAAPDARPLSAAESEGMSDGTDTELRVLAGAARRSEGRSPVRRPGRTVRTALSGRPVGRVEAVERTWVPVRVPVPYPVRCVVLRC